MGSSESSKLFVKFTIHGLGTRAQSVSDCYLRRHLSVIVLARELKSGDSELKTRSNL